MNPCKTSNNHRCLLNLHKITEKGAWWNGLDYHKHKRKVICSLTPILLRGLKPQSCGSSLKTTCGCSCVIVRLDPKPQGISNAAYQIVHIHLDLTVQTLLNLQHNSSFIHGPARTTQNPLVPPQINGDIGSLDVSDTATSAQDHLDRTINSFFFFLSLLSHVFIGQRADNREIALDGRHQTYSDWSTNI